jgi:hypothetical protein
MRTMSTISCKLLSILKTQTCSLVLLLIALLKSGPFLPQEKQALENQAQTIHLSVIRQGSIASTFVHLSIALTWYLEETMDMSRSGIIKQSNVFIPSIKMATQIMSQLLASTPIFQSSSQLEKIMLLIYGTPSLSSTSKL